jgi:zinc/manganese transport system ATP-binding protein
MTPVVSLRDATLHFGDRVIFDDLDLDVYAGEFIAVLGPNGSGKTTLLQVMLGIVRLTAGSAEINGRDAARGNRIIGYVPQQHAFDRDLPIRGRDLVAMGIDGHRFGWPGPRRSGRAAVDGAIAAVGGQAFAGKPIGMLSGGEQQRLRIAQALVSDPKVLLCDEPLLSLDLTQQGVVSALIDARRRRADTAVVFVTHEINPVLPVVDRVLYLVDGRFRIGTADEVMNSATLSELYGSDVEVARVGGKLVVSGTEDADHHVGEEAR